MFDHYITSPIIACKVDGIERLKRLVQSTSLRRTKKSEVNDLKLPLRESKVSSVEFSKAERDDYNFIKQKTADIVFSSSYESQSIGAAGSILPIITKLRQVCDGRMLLPPKSLKALDQYKGSNLLGTGSPEIETCANCGNDLARSCYELHCGHLVCDVCMLQAKEDDSNIYAKACVLCTNQDFDHSIGTESGCINSERAISDRYGYSSKVAALMQNLQNDRSNYSQSPFKR